VRERLLEQFLGDENVAEYARESHDQDHLQNDTDTRDIAAEFTESTTQKSFHYLHLQFDFFSSNFVTQLSDLY
jgi:hypothetical protein